ncbi:MAG: indolepyruvate oxidoreductase subunit beta [Methanosphaera sp.]|uniref:indolepyruvate oxidoreductase subunit beta n=1 Tax=Methanosphaera sp. TaxID=2666342 RepID=UPI0025D8AFDC|nr:indolepyruvate oxidoreductase subunit beta [Methanosphaera sp.]MCI5867138.1 indolepyruvate oxidoreductase subunit beta [Methanosphaera sp.]MDD6534793.1 indolepyruvate oxidoreductase subunit beta [Methanosphaera sp.]MDY3955539.1 indolepyruvate oxidoreductase subunit beta [Methanosphaera sp.]
MAYNIYICGIGGQGIIKTSIVIGETALSEDLNVVMSEIHGMSQRGGVVSTELKIGDDKSPIIQNGTADILLAFEPVEALRALEKTNENTVAIVNTSAVYPSTINQQDVEYPDIDEILEELSSKMNEVYSMDANKIAVDAGHPLSMNMAMVGGACAVSTFPLEIDDVKETMKNNLPEKSIETNLKAFMAGYEKCRK